MLVFMLTNNTTATTNYCSRELTLSGFLQGADEVGGLLSITVSTPSDASSYFPLADLSAKAYYAAEDANRNCLTFLDDAGVSPIRVSRGLCVVFLATTYSLICGFMLAPLLMFISFDNYEEKEQFVWVFDSDLNPHRIWLENYELHFPAQSIT